MLLPMDSGQFQRFGYADAADAGMAAVHPLVLMACIAMAPAIGHLPADMVVGVSVAFGSFFFFSEGVRRVLFRRHAFPGALPPPYGGAAIAALAVCAPALMVMGGAWVVYGFASWRAAAFAMAGFAYIACAITAAEAITRAIGSWRRWVFHVACVVLHPIFLFGPLFRPDAVLSPGLYRLSLWNPLVPGIEVVRAGLFGVPMRSPMAVYAWTAFFMVICLWFGGIWQLGKGRGLR